MLNEKLAELNDAFAKADKDVEETNTEIDECNNKILEYYRMIGKMRREEPLFKNGYLVLSERSKDGFFEFSRENGSEALTVAVNLSDKEIEMKNEGIDLLKGELSETGRKLAYGECAVIKHK